MPILSAEEFWDLITRSGLVEPAIAAALRRAFATRPGATVADSRTIAAWLAETGVLTPWQARRVANGDPGPFVIGDYCLLERHEFAGAALLFTARHVPSGNVVRLVRLDPRACAQPDSWATLVRRVSVANRLTDPALSRTWALEQVGNHRLVVCEQIAGTSLADELAFRGPLPLAEAGATALRIAAAVAEIHAAGEVHGSLSLDTVIRPGSDQKAQAVGPGGEADAEAAVRLLQFPLADDPHRFPVRPPLDTAEQIDRLGRRAAFVAPELALPGAVCDPRSDVYALGCILHALVSGRLPGREGDPRASLRDAATIGLPPLGPPVPAEIGTLVGYLADRDPAGRYPTAIEAAHAIATCFRLPWSPPGAVAAPAAVVPAVRASPTAVVQKAVAPRFAQSPEAWFWKLMAWMFGLFFLAIVSLTIAWFERSSQRSSVPVTPPPVAPPRAEPLSPDRPPAEPTAEATPTAQAASLAAAVLVSDAPDLPWVGPTTGPPPTLEYLPPGAQLVLLARPADLMSNDEGGRLVRAFGPGVAAMLEAVAGVCGCDMADIDQLQAAWQGDPAGGVVATLVVRLIAGRTIPDADAFTSRAWIARGTSQIAGSVIHNGSFLGQDAAFWLPEREAGRVLVVATPAIVESIVTAWAQGSAEPAALPQPLETLLGMLDGTRHVTLFGMPHFLFTNGRSLLIGPLGGLAEPLAEFFGDDVQAAAISLHVADDAYVEFDAVAPRDVSTARLATRLVADVERLPAVVEDYCVGVDVKAYGRRLIQRLPQMLQILVANLRGGGEGRGAVLNARLPRQAGHNIVLAAELALAQPPVTIAAAAAPPAAPAREDARAKLRRIITLSFSKDTLEKSIQMLSDEIGVPMEILGGDLQLEGITKNQSFGLGEVERPAEAVLRAILAKANPDGKLIYVIRSRDGVESIEITTRSAAEKRGDPVPAVPVPAVSGPS